MESRWYLLPGQTLENTKISERGHALHVSGKEWKKITGHLDRKRLIAEAAEKERAHKQALKEESDAMTRTWPDSIEHVHHHKEEERRKRAEELERQRMENYHVLRKEQAEIKEEYMKKVKVSMFYEKSYPKLLNGALMLSEALYEREKQKEFKKMIDQHYEEEERKYAEKVKRDAEDEKREKEEKAAEERKKKLELKEIYLREMKQKEEAAKRNAEKKKEQELKDSENTRLEGELQEQMRLEDILIQREENKRELEEFLTGSNEFKKMLKKEDDEVEEVIKVFEKAKHQIECLRKEKQEEIHRQQLARREAISKRVIAAAKAKEEVFEKTLKKAQEEADAKEEEKHQARLERQRQLRKDREEDRLNYLERKAEDDRTLMEGKKWEMLNRLKSDEVIKEYNEEKVKEKLEKAAKYRGELLEQMASNQMKLEDKIGQQQLDAFVKQKIKETDDDFFGYAEKLIDYARKNNRPVYPILKVVRDYKKDNGIMEEKETNYMRKMSNGTIMNGNVKMVNITPGKMAHDPKADPNYRRCRCHKDRIIK